MNKENKALLRIYDLKKHYTLKSNFFSKNRVLRAVDGINLSINHGETFGLVGESGCGKTTAGKCILRLVEPTSGYIELDGEEITHIGFNHMREVRKKIQFIFQDPYSSLNPRMTVGQIIGEPLAIHGIYTGKNLRINIENLIEKVGLPIESYNNFPHEFSGGQRQRVGIARALALKPKLVICDEPVSALDVSIQSQILNLMIELQNEYEIAYIFISHGLTAVKHISKRVGVMYLGKIVEIAETEALFSHPLHPYTEALLSAIPLPDPESIKEKIILEGDVPNPINPPSGCRFHNRCRHAIDICRKIEPIWKTRDDNHFVACHLC